MIYIMWRDFSVEYVAWTEIYSHTLQILKEGQRTGIVKINNVIGGEKKTCVNFYKFTKIPGFISFSLI